MHARQVAPALPLDHVAIAVASLEDAAPGFERISGRPASSPHRVESQGVDVCFVGAVEFLAPFRSNSPVARFLERRGPGLHHVAYRTDDLTALMKRLAAEGCEFTSPEPETGSGGRRVAFVHPRSAGGVLVELVEK